MTYEMKPNTGTLFRNDKKTEDRHPTHRGECEIDGVRYWVAAWVNTSKNTGQRYFSLKFTRQERAGDSGQSQKQEFTDDIPF